jgi:hypothetical protein
MDEDVRRLRELIAEEAPQLEVEASGDRVSFGPFRYRYPSGREGDAHLLSVTRRKNHVALYVNSARDDRYLPEEHGDALGKVSVGRSCVRFKRFEDLDEAAVRRLVRQAVDVGGTGAISAP